jgi:hypothetical protein
LTQPAPFQSDPNVASQLAMMGLEADDLRDAVLDANAEALECTPNDVISRAGFVRWSSPLRRLGDIYVPKGHTRERPKGFELLVSPDRTFALTVAPGDHATGTDRMPSTRIDRGPLTGQAVTGNRHQLGFGEIDTDFARAMEATMKIWLLLVYYDELNEEIRLELSLPVEFTRTPKGQRGFVTAFEPRLVLPAISLVETADISNDDEDEDGQIDVPVARR